MTDRGPRPDRPSRREGPPRPQARPSTQRGAGPRGAGPRGAGSRGAGPSGAGPSSAGRGKPASSPKSPPTEWEHEAGWYDQLVGDEGSEYHRHVIFPGVARLVTPTQGLRLLDVGCGQGAFCRLMHAQGVVATGVDAAPTMIEYARERSDASIRYEVCDARELATLNLGEFDAASCILAIANMHPLPPVLNGIAGSLRVGGALVLAMMHPCFRQPKYSGWGWEAHDVQYRRVDRYLLPRKEPIVTHPGKAASHFTWTFHRPLQDYVRALAKAGLLVSAIEEWPGHKNSTSGPRAKAENVARKEIPLFMAIRAEKVGSL